MIFDRESGHVRIKRKESHNDDEAPPGKKTKIEETFLEQMRTLLPDLRDKLSSLNRVEAFVTIMRALISRRLDNSIVQHLWFDIGEFLKYNSGDRLHSNATYKISIEFRSK